MRHQPVEILAGARSILAGAYSILAGARSILAGVRSILAGARSILAGASSILAGASSILAGARSILAGASSILAGARSILAGAFLPAESLPQDFAVLYTQSHFALVGVFHQPVIPTKTQIYIMSNNTHYSTITFLVLTIGWCLTKRNKQFGETPTCRKKGFVIYSVLSILTGFR